MFVMPRLPLYSGDIISFNLLGETIIVLNSSDAAEDLLSKRSSIYSDRPRASTTMATSDRLVGWGNNTGIIRYGERWRAQRRMTHELLHKRASEELWPSIIKNSRLALEQLLDKPDEFESHLRRMAGSSIIKSVYGYEATASNDALFEAVSQAVQGFSQAVLASNFYVNLFPWMQYIPAWFPGAQWKRKALAWREQTDQMLNIPYNWTRDKMESGTAPPSMLSRLLGSYRKELSDKEKNITLWAAGTLFGAGTDTTVASSLIFVMAMAMHPEVQTRAQAEIDRVLGGSRLPEMDDRQSMPYVQAIVKEVLRWRSVLPLGVPHASIEEDFYQGYRIPKGATMAMSNDKRVYSNPERFDPSRYLDTSVPEAPAFGFGRRSCPGIHFAQAALFMVASGMLACFDISPKKDSEGHPIPLTATMGQNTITSQPLPFKVDIKARSEKHEQLLREWADM
ncbi:cytochrome P450 [Rhizoctonia solani]|uniref:Cytochrome P450 n=1 Tax=Rhizoctonia solani TaxID=456999 RepID=A0A8H7H334_9AGAM|nr:cytochrome P450 [Rhizoctonia solani]